MPVLIDDGPCTFTHDGHSATASGAYLDERGGVLYVADWCTRPGSHRAAIHHSGDLQTWHGQTVGRYVITGTWELWPPNGSYAGAIRMASIRAFIDGKEYTGKLGYEWSQAVRLRRSTRTEA